MESASANLKNINFDFKVQFYNKEYLQDLVNNSNKGKNANESVTNFLSTEG